MMGQRQWLVGNLLVDVFLEICLQQIQSRHQVLARVLTGGAIEKDIPILNLPEGRHPRPFWMLLVKSNFVEITKSSLQTLCR